MDDVKRSIETFVSHGSTHPINSYLQDRMSKQMHLTKGEFRLFVECPLAADDYARLMRHRGQIS